MWLLFAVEPIRVGCLLVLWNIWGETLFCHRGILKYHHICFASTIAQYEYLGEMTERTFALLMSRPWRRNEPCKKSHSNCDILFQVVVNLVSGVRFDTSLSVISYFFLEVFNISAWISSIFIFFVVSILLTCISVNAWWR